MPTAPEPLSDAHDTSGFVCRHASLAQWLQRRALANGLVGASRTYVVCEGRAVIGYYALAAGSVVAAAAPGRLRRNMPDPLPIVVLGRLAVHADRSGQGIGAGLLRDAVARSLQAADVIGACALVCHAIDDAAKAFYAHHGFVESPVQASTMLIGLRAR